MSNIKQWQERVEDGSSVYENQEAMQAEIADLRTAAQQALEALEELRYSSTTFKADKMYAEAKDALTVALESKA